MTREIVILSAAALAMAIAAPVCAAAGASNGPAKQAHVYRTEVAENSVPGSTADNAGQPAHKHHHSHRRYHHSYSSHRHHSRHHTRAAADDPKAAAPEATPTKGVIPRISP
jgi:hypothetical protein